VNDHQHLRERADERVGERRAQCSCALPSMRVRTCVCVSGCLYATDATRRDATRCLHPPPPSSLRCAFTSICDSHSHSHNFDSTIASRRLSENKHSNKKLQFASSICHMWCVRRDAISATSVIPSLLFIRCKTEIK